jgi:hypothetical protein
MPTFDGENLIITMDPAPGGAADVDVIDDLYEPWKDWVLSSPKNRKYPQAFRPDGGNPLSAIIDQGRYTFLNNVAGWRLKPFEQDGTWYLTGNLAVEDTALPAFLPTDGAFTAAILGLQPVTQGVTETMALQLEYSSFVNGVWVDQVYGEEIPAGTGYLDEDFGNARRPVLHVHDAIGVREARGLPQTMYILGDATFDTGDDLRGFLVLGQNAARSTITINAGAETLGFEVREAYVTGNLDGGAIIRNCALDNLNYINGYIYNCMLNPGTISLGGTNTAHFMDTKSGVPGLGTPILEWLPGENTPLALRGHDGGIRLQNKTGDAAVSIDLKAGQVIIDLSTCNNGTIVVRGDGDVFDQNGNYLDSGTYNTNLILYNRANGNKKIDEVHQRVGLNENKPVTNNTDGSYSVGDIVVDATVDGSGNITQTRQ